MKKVTDFSTYKRVKNLSFNDFNRWAISLYASGYSDGKAEADENCMASMTDEELLDIILSVKGIGQKRAMELMDKISEKGVGEK